MRFFSTFLNLHMKYSFAHLWEIVLVRFDYAGLKRQAKSEEDKHIDISKFCYSFICTVCTYMYIKDDMGDFYLIVEKGYRRITLALCCSNEKAPSF